MKYPNSESKSAAMFQQAQNVLTEGGSRSTIRIAPYSIYVREAKGKYVTFNVNAVVFQENGDRLGGGSNVERMYGVKGGESTHNPTEGMGGDLDDEIPF